MIVTGIPELDKYHHMIEHSVLCEIADLARALSGTHVVHINTTAKGGGVAEILESLIAFFRPLGIKHTWKTVQIDSSSAPFMTKLIDQLQGGESGTLMQKEQQEFHQALALSSQHLLQTRGDVCFIHDLQLAPLVNLLPNLQPAIWFCHMDVMSPNRNAQAYIEQCLNGYSLCVFNSPQYRLNNLSLERTQVITLGIDPFKPRNKYLTEVRGLRSLTQCGLDVSRPLITQVSRYDKWKNPWQAVDVYRLVKKEIPTVQLAFVGAMEATDDSTAEEIFSDLRSYTAADPDIHLLYDPRYIGQIEVNAFQRYSTVVMQRSTREGFGLAVTEAMWKRQPVVGTSATGMRDQITHQQTGYIVDETDKCAEYTVQLLQKPELRHRLGAQAHKHVRSNFLLPMMALSYLKAIAKVVR